ncbi:MAG: hypothetical protein ACYTDX_09725 [Planctomycetota bacterium]|jgi:hypothetical protein
MVLSRMTRPEVIAVLFRKAQGWNRIAKAAAGWSRRRAYRLKKRAVERIREICPDAISIDDLEWLDRDTLVVGVSIFGCGRLHLVLDRDDHSPGGAWCELPWEARHLLR